MRYRPVLCLVIFGFAAFRSPMAYAGFVTLDFDGDVPGTITDKHGVGSGFTHRLPGSGGALPSNDPNMDLLSTPGHFTLSSTRADINGGANLGQLEAPALLLSGIGAQDFSVSALFRDVRVPNGSDQLMLFVGTSTTNVVRAGFHELDVYAIVENTGSGDQRPYLSDFNAFNPGDDVLMTFARRNLQWQLSWQNLTNSGANGASSIVSLPWLDAESDLYVGVLAANAGTGTPFLGKLDYFKVQGVPEPSSVVLFGLAFTGLICLSRKRLSGTHQGIRKTLRRK
jgi:PEP-CTERM motif